MNTRRHANLSAFTLATLVIALPTGCANNPAETSDTSGLSENEPIELIAEAQLDNGGSIRFYEPEPGVLIQLEQGPSDAPRERVPGEEHMNDADKYALLTGNPAPDRLVAAAASVEHVEVPHASQSTEKGLSADDISRPGLRDDFLRLYCTQTDRFYWHLGYSKESYHGDRGINYYAWGINAIQGPTAFVMAVIGQRNTQTLEKELPEGWYAGAVIKVGGAGLQISSFGKPRADGALFDHCVNYHY